MFYPFQFLIVRLKCRGNKLIYFLWVFQFLIVRLKFLLLQLLLHRNKFQFLIVRLKYCSCMLTVSNVRVFQFLIVRLKFKFTTTPAGVYLHVSIPYSTIKISGADTIM